MLDFLRFLKVAFSYVVLCFLAFSPPLTALQTDDVKTKMEEAGAPSLKVFNYADLNSSTQEIIEEFKTKGFIAIRGVPGFEGAYKEFISAAKQFIALPKPDKDKCIPPNYENKGWSYGVEQLYKGLPDSFKGSYYVRIPEHVDDPNIWPASIPAFQKSYLHLSDIVFKTGKEILPVIGIETETHGLGRMLYYGPVTPDTNDKNPHWCALHRDHGGLTGLCSEIFFKEGAIVEKPKGSGLYIRGQEILCPPDVLMFQIGEWLELVTDGKVTATEHYVGKALNGSSRYAFAFFIDSDVHETAHCANPDVLQKYADRYKEGISFQEWHLATLAKFNPK